jgi:hypothetical protein
VDNTNWRSLSAKVPSRISFSRAPGLRIVNWFPLVGAKMTFVHDSTQVTN